MIYKIEYLLFGVAVMVGITGCVNDFGAVIHEEFFEALGFGNGGNSGDFAVFEISQRALFPTHKNSFQMLRLVAALNDFSALVVLAQKSFQVAQMISAVGFGEKYVVGAPEVFDRLAQNAARQNMVIAERTR